MRERDSAKTAAKRFVVMLKKHIGHQMNKHILEIPRRERQFMKGIYISGNPSSKTALAWLTRSGAADQLRQLSREVVIIVVSRRQG